MNHKVRAIDLKPGMYVIVQEWLDEIGKEPENLGAFFESKPKKKPIGDPMKVLAVALPLVTVEICKTLARGVLDSREIQFMQVDLKYVRSLAPQYGKGKPAQTDTEKRLKNSTVVQRYIPGEGWTHMLKEKK